MTEQHGDMRFKLEEGKGTLLIDVGDNNPENPRTFTGDGQVISGGYGDVNITPLYFSPSRTFIYNFGQAGASLCPSCGKYAVAEVAIQSTFPDEPNETSYGRKCLWCSWTGPCEEEAK